MRAQVALAALLIGCGGGAQDPQNAVPETLPLPITMVVGRDVLVLPLTLLSAQSELGWADSLGDRTAALRMADSMISDALLERAPEVNWVLPPRLAELRRRNPTVFPDPYRLSSAVLRGEGVEAIPDPLRAQLRTMAGFAAGRFAVVPAALFFTTTSEGLGRAQLSVVVGDIRTGRVLFRTVAVGEADNPRLALERALRTLVPATL